MRGIGRKINQMVLENKPTKINQSMRAISLKAKSTDLENLSGQMARFMKEILFKGICTVKESLVLVTQKEKATSKVLFKVGSKLRES